MVNAYWLIGREIVEIEQAGTARAGYGEEVLEHLSTRLRERFGEGFGVRTLRSIRRFYLVFPDGSAVPEIRKALLAETSGRPIRKAALSEFTQRFPPSLGWTHYLVLMKVANPEARAFYEIEAARQAWSTRQLERQTAALLYERLASNRTPEKVHQDLGQMMMYVNYYDRTQRTLDEAKTVGIVLCSEKNDAMVKITLPEDNDQILAATYKRYLPTEAELATELTREREEAERLLHLRPG